MMAGEMAAMYLPTTDRMIRVIMEAQASAGNQFQICKIEQKEQEHKIALALLPTVLTTWTGSVISIRSMS